MIPIESAKACWQSFCIHVDALYSHALFTSYEKYSAEVSDYWDAR